MQTFEELRTSLLRTDLRTSSDTGCPHADGAEIVKSSQLRKPAVYAPYPAAHQLLQASVRSPTGQMRQFGTYRLDLRNEGVWRGEEEASLKPRPVSAPWY